MGYKKIESLCKEFRLKSPEEYFELIIYNKNEELRVSADKMFLRMYRQDKIKFFLWLDDMIMPIKHFRHFIKLI